MPNFSIQLRIPRRVRRQLAALAKVAQSAQLALPLGVKQVVPPADADPDEKREAQQERSERFGIEVLQEEANLSYPEGDPTDLDLYGDPVNLKYPLGGEDNELDLEQANNARARFKQAWDTYSEERSHEVIHNRIVGAQLKAGATPSYDPDDPRDQLLSADIKEQLTGDDEDEEARSEHLTPDDRRRRDDDRMDAYSARSPSRAKQAPAMVVAGGPGMVVGLASVYGIKDLGGDVIERGAFAQSIAEGEHIPLYWQHEHLEHLEGVLGPIASMMGIRAMPIGVVERLEETDLGLRFEARLATTPRARQVASLLRDGVVAASSVAYTVRDGGARIAEDGTQYLSALSLREISVVTRPMNPFATAALVERADAPDAADSAASIVSLFEQSIAHLEAQH